MSKKFIFIFYLILISSIVVGCKNKDVKPGSTEVSSAPTITIVPTATTAPISTPIPTTASYAGPLAGIMSKEDYPIVDGSTATIPLSEAVYQLATGATPEEAAVDIVHTKTSNCYYRMMNKEVDLLIVYAPSEQVLADIEKDGNNLDIKPIGKDALVFMANTSNKVESLTEKQLVDIYSGKISNWSKVGGDNREILAFQRPENTGSQTLMLKLVMGKTPMVTGPNIIAYETMEGILEAMADYTNEGNTLGYSVFYYAQNMYQLPELKFMKVNGIEPSLQTIYDGSYPYINEFYAVVRKDEPVESNAHKIFDWLTGEEGQTLVKDLGYVPVSMKVKETLDTTELLKEDSIPEGYRYIGSSYSTHDGLRVGTITIYNNKWEPIRVFHNAYTQQAGLIAEDSMLPIGYAVFQKDTFKMKYGLYNLKEDKFALPVDYESMYVLDEEKGYYSVSDSKNHFIIDQQGNKLTPYFFSGEGYGVIESGDYFWINDYSPIEEKEKVSVYDSEFNLVNEFYRDYNEGALYEEDGSVYFLKKMFLKHFGYKDNPEEDFYVQSYTNGEPIFSVSYNGSSLVLDRKLNILAEKMLDANVNSYYSIYYDIFSDCVYNSETYADSGLFYDKNGKLILDKDGNSFTNIVSNIYWIDGGQTKGEQILYGMEGHTLNILHYSDGSQVKINLEDWENISVSYVFKDIVIVLKIDGEQRTRIYKGNKLLFDKQGVYNLAPCDLGYLANYIPLVNYGSDVQGQSYMIINTKGELIYESPNTENIVSIDEKYIQLERGNYWGVMDYEGNFIIRVIKNELIND